MLGVSASRYGYPTSPLTLAMQYAREADQRAKQRAYGRMYRIGQGPPALDVPVPLAPGQEPEAPFVDRLREGVRAVTPTLLIVGVATGFAFAAGSVLGTRFAHYIWGDDSRREREQGDGER